MPEDKGKLNKFFQDPDWRLVEDMILNYIEPLKLISSIKTSGSGADVKAQILANDIAYKGMTNFLKRVRILSTVPPDPKETSFK